MQTYKWACVRYPYLMASKTVLILGASQLALHIVDFLVELKIHTKIVVRDPKKAEDFTKKGVEVLLGDVEDKDFSAKAFQNIHTVISTLGGYTSAKPIHLQNELIPLAEKSGVKLFIPAMFSTPEYTCLGLVNEYMRAKYDGLEILKKSGMDYTIFYTGPFTETWLSPFFGFDPKSDKMTGWRRRKCNVLGWVPRFGAFCCSFHFQPESDK